MRRRPGVALLALAVALAGVATSSPVAPQATINRHSHGDIFSQPGAAGECSATACVSALGQRHDGSGAPARPGRHCQCQCPAERPVYREDVQQCVSTFEECPLADYVSGLQSEKVPFVFLPVQGQLINPQAEIALSDVRAEGQMVVSPVCVVSKAHFLTRSGWAATDNATSADAELPFALARDAGRTHLQWLGEPRLRSLMEGRIVLVRLLCKDTANQRVGVFSPCIAFRVAGSPGFMESVRVGSGALDNRGGLRQADYLAIGISSALLGTLYVAGLVGFICYRRRRRQLENVHVKLSAPGDEPGVIRLNPLVHPADAARIGAQFARASPDHEATGTRSSTRSSNRSSSQDGGSSRRYGAGHRFGGQHAMDERYQQQQQQSYEASDVTREAQFFYARDVMSDNARRLLFTPQYFDPDLLKSPPPAAVEFLARLRAMIDIAKDRMSAKRFMPSLIDIPEELSYCSAYGSNPRLSSVGQEVLRSESFADARYGTLKRPLNRSESTKAKSTGRKAKDEAAPPDAAVDLLGANFLQKSPLPGRKAPAFAPDTAQLIAGHASIYTNPSIEEIYRSLDRHQTSKQQPAQSTPKAKLATLESGDSDAVSDLVSEAESKVPKIDALERRPAAAYFEPDSLDRRHDAAKSARPVYQKKVPAARWARRAHYPDTSDEMREADEQSSSAAGYASSTCTSVQSLSRVLPAQEAVEIGNQLFNMDTGATTLPRAPRASGAPIPSSSSPTGKDHIYEKIGEKRRREKGFYLVNACGTRERADGSSDDSSASAVTVVEDKAHADADDAFVADSLERPVKSAIRQLLNSTVECPPPRDECANKEELPVPGSVVSLRRIYSARQADDAETGRHSWTPALEPSKRPASRLVSAANTEVLHRFAGRDEFRPFHSLPADEEPAKGASPSPPPPLPLKSLGSLGAAVAPAPPRALKPSAPVRHLPPPTTKPPPPPPPPKHGDVRPPTLPPKNASGGSCGSRTTATSAPTSLGVDQRHSGKVLCNNFILSDATSSGDGGSRRSSASSSGASRAPNVLERIAQIEREESRISSASKGMEIALSLRARMGHLEGSLKDHKKTSSIKKTWRKLLDKVEDSFSETESASSTLRRPAAKALPAAKKLPPPPPSDDDDESDESDDRSRSSLGSDGTGSASAGVAASVAEPSTPVGVKLKSYYTFGEDGRLPSPLHTIKTGSGSSAVSARRLPGANNNRARRSANSYDSGVYSGNYSTYIGDY